MEESKTQIKRETTPFTESGECIDEIEFVFDDERSLYVSQNFLKYVSPVFKAMFEHDFKEKENKSVTMTGKKYEDVLEFLLCLHPNMQKSVTKDNVLSVVHIAEEYQAELMITRCQSVMSDWLKSELALAQTPTSLEDRSRRARTCLRVMSEANSLQYETLVKEACTVIAYFGHVIFTGTVLLPPSYSKFAIRQRKILTNVDNPVSDCKKLFDNLSIELKYELIQKRLKLCDTLEMYEANEY
ncbi:BTB and MATH domain-containing protein 38-like [Ruditapes philippinarum]|uniref:BTB and MATH domain-containing protein 38-like n=1 Tax=Ruditapes philippinarum TaxID=129788 RepID=UPI00295B9E38|nr:BTB and MATH domain-containing protein 38-like [Ruditapes philippinarum]